MQCRSYQILRICSIGVHYYDKMFIKRKLKNINVHINPIKPSHANVWHWLWSVRSNGWATAAVPSPTDNSAEPVGHTISQWIL